MYSRILCSSNVYFIEIWVISVCLIFGDSLYINKADFRALVGPPECRDGGKCCSSLHSAL